MKILSADLIREADAYTIEHEPIRSVDLMERAAQRCFDWIYQHIPVSRPITIVAGTGNNGGDGLAIARMLVEQGYRIVVFLAGEPEVLSPDCRVNHDRLIQMRDPGCRILGISDPGDANIIHLPLREGNGGGDTGDGVIIDALFGSGLTRPVTGIHAEMIRSINNSGALVVSIDVPSGLFMDKTVLTEKDPVVVQADYTLSFAPPKLAFFFPENNIFTGEWILLDIGLSETFIRDTDVKDFMVTPGTVKPLLRKRDKYAHKGNFGHALLICGSQAKMGAAVLAAKACLRSGAGLVTVRVPRTGVDILQTAAPEAMLTIDPDDRFFTELPRLDGYSAVGIGPGIGIEQTTGNAFKHLIQEGRPMVIDADALNILGENKTWLGFLPPGCILTPHPKEFERIAGKTSDDFDRNHRQRELSFKYSCYIILKGAHTAITTPDGRCYFNTTGNPGMATGGSGDVLTGILTGLFAQGYPPLEVCLMGVYLHGMAGDLASKLSGPEALIAGDIIGHLGKAFETLYGEL